MVSAQNHPRLKALKQRPTLRTALKVPHALAIRASDLLAGATLTPARVVLLISLLPAAALPLPAQQPPASGGPVTTIQTTARQVVLDVVVTDSQGQSVKGMRQSGFLLYEDGIRQTILGYTERDAASQATPAPASQLPPNTFTNRPPLINNVAMTAILFDTSELPFTDAAYARDQVAAYVKTVPPGTPICIFDLDPWGLRLVQDFTTDPQVLRQAVESKRNAQKPRRPAEFTPPLRRAPAMRELARYLSAFPGRKNLIWFSGTTPHIAPGRPGSLFPDSDTLDHDIKGISDTLTLNRVALYPIDPRGVVFDPCLGCPWVSGSGSVAPNVVIRDFESDVLEQGGDNAAMATVTGGKAFYNSNAIKQDVAEVVATGSHYYTLSYTPTNTHWDGSFRTIKVQLANGGVAYLASLQPPTQLQVPLRLEYRSGYYASPDAQRISPATQAARQLISYSPVGDPNAAQGSALDDAMSYGAVAPFQILFNAHIDPDPATEKLRHNAQRPPGNYLDPHWRSHPYRNYQIHFSIDPQDIQFAQHTVESFHDTIEFVAVVYDNYGAIVNSFIKRVPVDVNSADYSQIMQSGLGVHFAIAISAKGDFYLRLGVHDLNSDRIGALEIPLESIQLPH